MSAFALSGVCYSPALGKLGTGGARCQQKSNEATVDLPNELIIIWLLIQVEPSGELGVSLRGGSDINN